MFKSLGFIPFVLLNLNNTDQYLDNSFLRKNNFYYENENLIVKGNIDTLDSSKFLDDCQNKDLLIFDFNSKIDDVYFGFFYDFESNKTFYLETNSNDLDNLYDDLKTFYLEYNTTYNNVTNLVSNNTNLFKVIKSSTISKVAKPYGRMAFTYSLKEYEYSNITSLYLLDVKQQFICGYNCLENDEKGFEKYYNYNQYVHISAYQNESQMGYDDVIKSGIPKFKDAYPNSEPTKVTISSSYQSGATFGYSFKNGFSLTNISIEGNASFAKNVAEGYSKTYSVTNPTLSSQIGQDLKEYQWNYFYVDPYAVTNTQSLGYMFECNRYQDNIDTHNKFDLKLTAKASYVFEDGSNKKDIYFTSSLR